MSLIAITTSMSRPLAVWYCSIVCCWVVVVIVMDVGANECNATRDCPPPRICLTEYNICLCPLDGCQPTVVKAMSVCLSFFLCLSLCLSLYLSLSLSVSLSVYLTPTGSGGYGYGGLDTAEMDTAEMDTAEMDTAEMDTADVDTIELEWAESWNWVNAP